MITKKREITDNKSKSQEPTGARFPAERTVTIEPSGLKLSLEVISTPISCSWADNQYTLRVTLPQGLLAASGYSALGLLGQLEGKILCSYQGLMEDLEKTRPLAFNPKALPLIVAWETRLTESLCSHIVEQISYWETMAQQWQEARETVHEILTEMGVS